MQLAAYHIEQRLDRFVAERLTPAIYRATSPLTVSAWEAPGEPVPFDDAIAQNFSPFSVGAAWGRPWGTVWFHLTGVVPKEWTYEAGSLEALVNLGFSPDATGFQAEGMFYSAEGTLLKGLEPLNHYLSLAQRPGETVDFYVEAAANPNIGMSIGRHFAPTDLGRLATAGDDLLYILQRAELGARDREVWELVQDIWTLRALAHELPVDLPRSAELYHALDAVVDIIDPTDVSGTASAGRARLAPALAATANASAHRMVAVGHAHIDSAWLWPVRETVRKCARTFSNVLDLMDADPDLIFACSSAQQFAWMKEFYPELYARITARVLEGRFIPVGGMWVESDTNLPGSEALARQFIEGKRFFLDEFGFEPLEVWLPDSFGYTAALPQIALAAGATSFLTQKLSWNEINLFPHHTFAWEGIDGSRIFTHFPPVDTYNSNLSGEELARAQRNYTEKGVGNSSLVPFGWGDGGGGPTREMMAAARRTRSLEGSPTVTVGTPKQFFDQAKAEIAEPAVWTGELYLEFHRGTYTSQARTKRGNRRSEALLHEAELWATTATIRTGAAYPYAELQKAWRIVLLQQFHDILPGSAIGWVYDVAEQNYADVAASLETLIANAMTAVAGSGSETLGFNASPYEIEGVPALSAGSGAGVSFGTVEATQTEAGIVLGNDAVVATIDANGLLSSVIDRSTGREVIPAGTFGNLLQLFRDTPRQWDAWDVDREYRRNGQDLVTAESVELESSTAESATVRIVRRFGDSSATQLVTVSSHTAAIVIETEVDWHERQKLLKLGFPIDVHTAHAASEIQFGHIVRPTHTNTSWDTARFETAAHRWVHVSDASFGVGIANDSTYGHDVTRTDNGRGRTYTTVRQSLLKAPLYPDPTADQGIHTLRSSLLVGDIPASVREGYRLRTPLRATTGSASEPLVASGNPSIVIETVKLALDRSGDVIVRLYEAHGTRAHTTLTTSFEHESVIETDLLERAVSGGVLSLADGIRVELNPFQLVTLRFGRVGAGR
jgi:alpha-mannosidase